MNKSKNNAFYRLSTFVSTVIRRRYSLLEVPWRGIHNVIALAMSICVAFGNKVMDTPELPQPIKRHEAPKYDICSVGRSMIEMLGVLAIIAVLSVGGIAGYSKAMEKFKVNKAIEAYSYLIYGILEHADDVKKLAPETPLANFVQAINAAPNNWKYISAYRFSDNLGNVIQMRTINGNGKAGNAVSESYQWAPGENVIVIDFFLGGFQKNSDDSDVSQNFSDKLCTELFTNVAYPLHAALINAHIYQDSQTKYILGRQNVQRRQKMSERGNYK